MNPFFNGVATEAPITSHSEGAEVAVPEQSANTRPMNPQKLRHFLGGWQFVKSQFRRFHFQSRFQLRAGGNDLGGPSIDSFVRRDGLVKLDVSTTCTR